MDSRYGIRRISEICFCIGLSLMFSVLVLDNTVFLLNLYVQVTFIFSVKNIWT